MSKNREKVKMAAYDLSLFSSFFFQPDLVHMCECFYKCVCVCVWCVCVAVSVCMLFSFCVCVWGCVASGAAMCVCVFPVGVCVRSCGGVDGFSGCVCVCVRVRVCVCGATVVQVVEKSFSN